MREANRRHPDLALFGFSLPEPPAVLPSCQRNGHRPEGQLGPDLYCGEERKEPSGKRGKRRIG